MIPRLNAALVDRYEIEREIGTGGMATVFLASDLRHRRQVAVKVLHPELSSALGPERFLREIEIAAGLSHPHILPVHDSGEADGLLYYVMPYVEGESLRDRLDREKELPVEEAIQLASEIADGLSFAHAQGIIHRDIKPGNILLSGSHALIADFGIARAAATAGPKALTETGVSIGTPQYMSPEQASGSHQIDARTDQYALACVVYEMLAGRPPHTGANVQAIVASILTEPVPRLRDRRDTIPPVVEYAVNKGLANLPADRFKTVEEFARTLSGENTHGIPTWLGDPTHDDGAKLPHRFYPIALAGAVGFALLALWSPWRATPTPSPVARFTVGLETEQVLDDSGMGRPVAVSPDGTRFVYSVVQDGSTRLYQRETNALVGTPIRGTEGARGPFFSPDGNWVAFFADGFLKKVSLMGGAPQVLAEVEGVRSATWGPDGTIIFGAVDIGTGSRESLWAVAEDGGDLRPASRPDLFPGRAQEYHWTPGFLPDGETVLFTAWGLPGDSFGVAARTTATGDQRLLVPGGAHPVYLPTGHLLYARGTDLFAAPFDAEEVEILGPAVPVLEGVGHDWPDRSYFSVAENGTLAYVSRSSGADSLVMAWVDTEGGGSESTVSSEYRRLGVEGVGFRSPRISPDGDRILLTDGTDGSIWVFDTLRKVRQRVTDDSGDDYWAVWSQDGDRVLFNSIRPNSDVVGVYSTAAAGGGESTLISGDLTFASPQSVARDRGFMAILGARLGAGTSATESLLDPATGQDIWVMDLEGDRDPNPFLNSRAHEFHPAFSADGRWLAYASDESGSQEVYVRPYPGPGPAIQISASGGGEPLWSPTESALYYRSVDGRRIMGVRYQTDPDFVPSSPELVAQGPFAETLGQWGRNYDISPDGRRFLLIIERTQTSPRDEFVVVLNWFEEVREKTAAAGTF